MQQQTGLGKATSIEKLEITWPVTGKMQVIKSIQVDKNIKIKEDDSIFIPFKLVHLDFTKKAAQGQHHH